MRPFSSTLNWSQLYPRLQGDGLVGCITLTRHKTKSSASDLLGSNISPQHHDWIVNQPWVLTMNKNADTFVVVALESCSYLLVNQLLAIDDSLNRNITGSNHAFNIYIYICTYNFTNTYMHGSIHPSIHSPIHNSKRENLICNLSSH